MEIMIKGSIQEITALVLAVQERRTTNEVTHNVHESSEFAKFFEDKISELSSKKRISNSSCV